MSWPRLLLLAFLVSAVACHTPGAVKSGAAAHSPCPTPKEVAAALSATAEPTQRHEAARTYLTRCGRQRVVALTQALVAFPTITGQRGSSIGRPFSRMAEFLRGWADEAGLDFRVFGANEVWEIGWGAGERWLAFVLHADVVPVSSADVEDTDGGDAVYPGWDHPPFDATVIDNRLYGRGTEDDKGPLAAVMIVLETLAAFRLETPGQTLAIIGTDEESSWDGMLRYVQTQPLPRRAVSVDSAFPVVIGENGFVVFGLEVEQASPPASNAAQLVDLQAGEFLTQVPAQATLRLLPAASEKPTDFLVRVQREALAEVALWPTGSTTIHAESDEGTVRVRISGKAVHSSTPEEGFNPLWPAAGLCERLGVAADSAALLLRLVHRFGSGDHLGVKLGLAYEHPIMGPLIVAPTVMRGDAAAARLRFNMRRPAGLTEEEFNQRLDRLVELVQREVSTSIIETDDRYVGNPVYAEPNSPLARLLVDVYQTGTGDMVSTPLTVRGGSYARLFPGGVSFGPSLPGRPYLGHAPNEYIEVDTLDLLTRLLLEVVHRAAQPTNPMTPPGPAGSTGGE